MHMASLLLVVRDTPANVRIATNAQESHPNVTNATNCPGVLNKGVMSSDAHAQGVCRGCAEFGTPLASIINSAQTGHEHTLHIRGT